MDPLSPEEIERYKRHILLPEIGGAGQQRLKAARVLVIGAGGLGAPVLHYLAAAGVGTLGLIDDDVVSLSNLQRQVIHDSGTIGELKTASARAASPGSTRMSAPLCMRSGFLRSGRMTICHPSISLLMARITLIRVMPQPTPQKPQNGRWSRVPSVVSMVP